MNAKRTVIVLLSIFVGAFVSMAQTKVSGRVTDASGQALPGVSIMEKGTNNGAITDLDGRYSINVQTGKTLVVSCMGYSTVETKVASSVLDVVMQEDNKFLDEVVVVGFSTQKKINVTGAVATMDAKAFESVPVQNAVQALQGKVPGLLITQSSGQLNSKASMQIRGLATIGEGSVASTLVLIDGIEGDLYSINPQDIQDISVLKDAAASSIYGSRAPFGVILVTTKSGASGKAKVNYNNSFRYSTPLNMPQEMDSYTWALYMNDAARNTGASPWIADETLQRIKDYMNGVIEYNTIPMESNPNMWQTGYDQSNDNIDYYKVFYKSLTKEQEHNVSISGGAAGMNYYLSGNVLHQDGYMRWGGDGLNRYNMSAKFNADAKPWLSVNYVARFTRTEYNQPMAMNNDMFFAEIGRQSWPIGPLYDPNGNLFNDHVLRMKDGGRSGSQTSTLSQQLGLVVKPLKGWKMNADVNYRYNSYFYHEDAFPVGQYGVDGVTIVNSWDRNWTHESSSKNDYANVNITIDYEHSFDNGHYFKVLAGFQTEISKDRNVYATINGIVSPDVVSIDSATGLGTDGSKVAPKVGGGYGTFTTAGFFGRVNYNYKERYLFEVNLRYDGSSRFRVENRWGLFPSVSVGWNMATEDFLRSRARNVDVLKVRASWGKLGNQYTSSLYPTYSALGFSSQGSNWLIGGEPYNASWAPGLVSSSLTWEKIETANVGLDWGFFKGRLTGSLDAFVRDTKDMVGPAEELPVILGTAVPSSNNTNLRSKGFELEIGWKDTIGKDFSYAVRVCLSDATSVITKYSNPSGSLYKNYVGKQWGEIWGYETVGIARSQEEMDAHLSTMNNGAQNFLGSDWSAGDIMYKDSNGDGRIDNGSFTIDDHGDMSVIGNSTPRYNYGIDISLAWKGVDFSMFLQGVGKRDYFQDTYWFWGAYRGIWWSHGTTVHEDYFRDDPAHELGLNLDSYYPRPLWNTFKNYQVQTRYLQNAAYLRIKNLQLGYTLPHVITGKIGIQSVRIFFSGENLATLTKMTKLYDPETIGSNLCMAYPLSRTYSFGVSVTL